MSSATPGSRHSVSSRRWLAGPALSRRRLRDARLQRLLAPRTSRCCAGRHLDAEVADETALLELSGAGRRQQQSRTPPVARPTSICRSPLRRRDSPGPRRPAVHRLARAPASACGARASRWSRSGSATSRWPSTSRSPGAIRWRGRRRSTRSGSMRRRWRGCSSRTGDGWLPPRTDGSASETQLGSEDEALRAARQARSDRREGRVRLQGEVNALRTRATAAQDEIGRLTAAWEAAKARSAAAQAQFAVVESEVAGLDSGEVDLDARYEVGRCGPRGGRGAGQRPADRRGARGRPATQCCRGPVRRRARSRAGPQRRVRGADGGPPRSCPVCSAPVAEVVGVPPGDEAAVAAAAWCRGRRDHAIRESLADAAAAIGRLKA